MYKRQNLRRLLYIGQAVVAVPDDVDGLHDLAVIAVSYTHLDVYKRQVP